MPGLGEDKAGLAELHLQPGPELLDVLIGPDRRFADDLGPQRPQFGLVPGRLPAVKQVKGDARGGLDHGAEYLKGRLHAGAGRVPALRRVRLGCPTLPAHDPR